MKMLNKKGFTLIELIVVIAILGILGMVAIPKVMDSVYSARVNSLRANFDMLQSTINANVASTGVVPADAAAVNALLSGGKTVGTDAATPGTTGIVFTRTATNYTLTCTPNNAPTSLRATDIKAANFPAPYTLNPAAGQTAATTVAITVTP